MKLTIGFSPCPNDTFIFDAMVNGKVDTHGLEFEYILEDVETLNRWATDGRLDITKLSYHAFLHTVKDYALLHSGSALGKGVGPLLVSREPLDLADIKDFRIAIPGFNTTANLLLSLAFPQAKEKQEIIFNEIEQAVLSGAFDAGLVIHESRFTYEQKGLKKLIDLGDWWETTMKASIPLGGIVIKRSLGPEISKTVDEVIRASLKYSWDKYPELSAFVTGHAQEMEESVMRQHIELYVNEFTNDLGVEGTAAVQTVFEKGQQQGLIDISDMPSSIFY